MREKARNIFCVAGVVVSLGCGSSAMDADPSTAGLGDVSGQGGAGSGGMPAPGSTGYGGTSNSGGATGAGGVSSLPSSNSCAGPALAWRTPTVSFQAESFGIWADGHCYTSATAKVDVNGDPGDSRYTTLELEWNENNREMRYFIYFGADRSGWWSDEMRTYDGQEPHND